MACLREVSRADEYRKRLEEKATSFARIIGAAQAMMEHAAERLKHRDDPSAVAQELSDDVEDLQARFNAANRHPG